MSEEQKPPAAAGPAATGGSQQVQAAAGDRHAALYARLRSQVEFYFSPQNLARDTYLRNMLTLDHSDMPSPRPGQFMCPVGVITNFPKVKDICAQFGEASEPPPLLLTKALEGSNVATIPTGGNWIGPVLQSLPPLIMGGAPPRGPHSQPHFQQPHHFQPSFQQGPYPPNMHQHRMMPMVPPTVQQTEGVAMQYQPGMPYPPHGQHLNVPAPTSLGGTDSPSSASLESVPSQQHQALAQQAVNTKGVVFVAVMDLPLGVNPIEILSAFTTESIHPKSAFVDSNTSTWFVAFSSEGDAKAAINASSERTISGAPIHAKLNIELPSSSKVSVASASVASLSSTSALGGQMTQQQQPIPFLGQPPGAFPLPPGPSPPPPMAAQNVMQPYSLPAAPPQYAMSSLMQPLAGMPPGQPFPPYFAPQQMQQVYPGNFMQPPLQQGGPQPLMHPYQHQMGTRFGVPPPPPVHGYPGGPPPPYPQYQGMPQYMSDGYPGHYHPHPRQYYDRRQGGSLLPGSFHDHNKRNDVSSKKKNSKNQQHRRESHESGSLDTNTNGLRRNNDYNGYGGNYHQQHSRNDSSTSPVPGDHRGKWKKRGEHDDQFRRSHERASPSFNRHYQRRPNDRLSSSDTTGSPSRQNNEANKSKEIFSSSDFPGLGGGRCDSDPEQQGNKPGNYGEGTRQQLVGYANALLKKEADEKKKDTETSPTVTTDNDVDSITRQTEEMEREILSEFHDLSLIGEGNKDASSSPIAVKHQQAPQHNHAENAEGQTPQTVGTASSSITDARLNPNSLLPILPGPFPENDGVVSQENSSELPKEQRPVIDTTNSEDFPSRESANENRVHVEVEPSNTAEEPTSFSKEETDPVMSTDPIDVIEETPGVWGSKRFADVI